MVSGQGGSGRLAWCCCGPRAQLTPLAPLSKCLPWTELSSPEGPIIVGAQSRFELMVRATSRVLSFYLDFQRQWLYFGDTNTTQTTPQKGRNKVGVCFSASARNGFSGCLAQCACLRGLCGCCTTRWRSRPPGCSLATAACAALGWSSGCHRRMSSQNVTGGTWREATVAGRFWLPLGSWGPSISARGSISIFPGPPDFGGEAALGSECLHSAPT